MKVIKFGAIDGTNRKMVTVPVNIQMIRIDGCLYDNLGTMYPLNYNNIYTQNQDIGYVYQKNNNSIIIKQYLDFKIVNGFIIIEYTKTTD